MHSFPSYGPPGVQSYWGNPKQPMKLQQPWNYDFGMFQFNLLGSQGGNSREMTTSPPRHTGERQQLHSQQPPNYKKSEPTAVKWRVRNSTRSMRFCVVSWLLSFQVPFGILWHIGPRDLRPPPPFTGVLRGPRTFRPGAENRSVPEVATKWCPEKFYSVIVFFFSFSAATCSVPATIAQLIALKNCYCKVFVVII